MDRPALLRSTPATIWQATPAEAYPGHVTDDGVPNLDHLKFTVKGRTT